MSDIEINEDNCVLDEDEIKIIDTAFTLSTHALSSHEMEIMFPVMDLLSLKIRKLNEMAQDIKDKKLVLVSQEFIEDLAREKMYPCLDQC